MMRYDIFRRYEDGSVQWMGIIENLERAQRRIEKLIKQMPGEYFVFDQYEQAIVTIVRTKEKTCKTQAFGAVNFSSLSDEKSNSTQIFLPTR